MCSIPGLPTPSSEVQVFITRVNLKPSGGLVELWVNMGEERKPIYEQMRKDIQSPGRKFCDSEGKPEELCLVCIRDTWHRARIVSIQNGTYNVFLIDQGQFHITTREALAWGQSDIFLLPPEIETCILANVHSPETVWSDKAAKFLKSLLCKKLKGLVQHVLMPHRIILLEIPTVSKTLCKWGVAKKIPGDEFKMLALKCLPLHKGEDLEDYRVPQEQNLNVGCKLDKQNCYFYPELSTDTFETVIVTEVKNPPNIFCQLQIFSKALETLSKQMHQHYFESSDFREPQPQTCWDLCAVKGLNGRWHRSLLKRNMTTNGAVEVLHVDEGKTELVPVGDIKPLHGKFLRMPVVTYSCSLDGVKDTGWTTDQTNHFKSLLLHRTVVARFDHHNVSQDVYSVTLYADNGACINSCFLAREGLTPPSKNEKDASALNGSIPSFLHSHGPTRCMHEQNKVNINAGLCEKTLPSPENQAVNGRTDDVPTSGADNIDVKDGLEEPDYLAQSNGHLSTSFLSNANDDLAFAVGSRVSVHVSCIESLQKFWCQTTEHADSLRHLMQELQNHYTITHPQPLVESICVARNPKDDKWYRARIVANSHSPVVDVRFIDYGHTGKVPLRNVQPIDPALVGLNAQAFQCCLFDPKSPTNPTAETWNESSLDEFRTFVNSGASSNTGLKCVVKAVTCDKEGLLLNVVDIETPSDSVCKLLAQSCAQTEAHAPIPPKVPSDVFRYSTYNIEVGGREKVLVTSSENVSHFYCQLDKNSNSFAKVMGDVKQFIGQPQCTDHPLGLGSICFARYMDNQWCRGQVVEMSPKLRVHFVDFGDILVVNESDICPVPTEASLVRSIPAQAVPLGLYNVPEEVPQEVNQWFKDHCVDHSFTISVVTKGAEGKLIVELFDGSLNVNVKVRERTPKITHGGITNHVQETEQQLPDSSKHANMPNEDYLIQELTNASVLTEQIVHSSNGICAGDDLKMSSQHELIKYGKTLDEGRNLDVILEEEGPELTETFIGGGSSDSEVIPLSSPCPEGNVKSCMYKTPNIALNKREEIYASCIVGPHYFWSQYTDTKDLNMVSRLAQKVGQAQQDMLSPKTLDPGSPCLALFSSDNQWYRAQVLQTTDNTLHVLFIDYGNESDVDIKNVRPLPQRLLDVAPQAFLCSLYGFDESKGSWDDDGYDHFYSLLIDKPLRVKVFNVTENSEILAPQYAVQIECENMVVNDAMFKYWKPVATENVTKENLQTENSLQADQTELNMTPLKISQINVTTCKYKNPNISKNTKEEVYASCIVKPHFFWCQCANSEELKKVLRLTQESGQAHQDMMFPKTLGPGSSCLALYPCDNQWYRAQVIHRTDHMFHVVFIDYGNESDVDVKNVRPLPQSLLDIAPQSFLCSLSGFDESRGSWDDQVYEDFYKLVVDKPLILTVVNVKDHSEIAVPQFSVEIECEGVVINSAMQKYWKPVAKERVLIKSPQTETVAQDGKIDSNMPHRSFPKENTNRGRYKTPNISKNKKEEVYASCIVEPHFFWCQCANSEELKKVLRLTQEAGQAQQDMMFPKTLGPGSSCLALYPCDNQWYRAQVIHRTDHMFHVVFIDYGNESDVDVKNVRPLPQSLLDIAPQSFLCSLSGFDESRGSWDDQVYEDFYNLLVDKPLILTVVNVKNHSEIAVPQYLVELECEGVVVKTAMEKNWKGLDVDQALAEGVKSAVDPET